MKILQILHFIIKNLYTMCFHRYRMMLIPRRGGKILCSLVIWTNFVDAACRRISRPRRRSFVSHIARSVPRSIRVASQCVHLTLTSGDLARERTRARARGFLWDRDRVEPRAHTITKRRRQIDPRPSAPRDAHFTVNVLRDQKSRKLDISKIKR